MLINLHEDYLDDLNIRMTHHSTALEGNTITLDETRDLLIDGVSPNRSVNIREIHEIIISTICKKSRTPKKVRDFFYFIT